MRNWDDRDDRDMKPVPVLAVLVVTILVWAFLILIFWAVI